MIDYSELSLRHIQYFIAIAEQGTMSKTSEQLYVSTSLLSQKISQMEDMIGIKLFHRNKRKLRLTAAGQQLLVDLKDIQAQLYHVLDSVRERYYTKQELIIGFTSYQEQESINYFLRHFRNEYPKLDFAVEVLPVRQLITDFTNRKIDIIAFIDFGKLRLDKTVTSRIAKMYPMACYMNPAIPAAKKSSINWKDLDGTVCVLPEHFRNSCFTRDLKRKFNEENITVSMHFHNSDIMTVEKLVMSNRYITFARYDAEHVSQTSGNLKVFAMPDLAYPFVIAYHTDADPSIFSYADTLYNIICQYFRREPDPTDLAYAL